MPGSYNKILSEKQKKRKQSASISQKKTLTLINDWILVEKRVKNSVTMKVKLLA